MGLSHSPGIIPDGLVFYFDPINPRSYAGTGFTGYNLIDTSIVGSFVGGAVYDVANKGSIYFDGSDDYINIPNATSLNPTTITISCWVKFNTFTNNANIISKGFTSVSSPFIQYSLKMGDVESTRDLYGFQISNNGVNATVTSSARLITNKYYFLTVTYDGTTLKLYKDGIQDVNTTTSAGALASYATPVQIGRWGTQGSQYFNGNVAVAIIYNRALSSTEILQNYNATKKRFSPEENILTNGLVLYFDAGNSSSYAGTGITAFNVAGIGYTAILVNSPTFTSSSGGGFVFNGTFKYILMPSIIDSNNDLTVSFWNRRLSTGTIHNLLHGVDQSGYFQIRYNASNAVQLVKSNAADMGSFTGYTSTANNDVYLTVRFTKSSNAYDLYINGAYISSITNAQTFVTTGPLLGSGYPGSEHFNGNIYSFTYYNRVLTSAEILQNYNALKGRYGLS